MFFLKILLGTIIVFIIPVVLFADMYEWTDEKGVKHFSNKKPPGHVKKIKSITEDNAQKIKVVKIKDSKPVKKKSTPEKKRMVPEAKTSVELEKQPASKKVSQLPIIRNDRVQQEKEHLVELYNEYRETPEWAPIFLKQRRNQKAQEIKEKIEKLERDPDLYFYEKDQKQ